MSKKAFSHNPPFCIRAKSNILVCSARFIHLFFSIWHPDDTVEKWCNLCGISNYLILVSQCITWIDKRWYWGEGQRWWITGGETDVKMEMEGKTMKKKGLVLCAVCMTKTSPKQHEISTNYSRPHRCQRKLPWRHSGWLPNLIGPSGCGTFFLHYGNWRCYRARSPIERPADHWEAEREREREKEGKCMLSFAS